MIYLKLFKEFFKIGLFTIGGGLASIPFLKELVDKYMWINMSELIEMIAISESTPGPIGINMATYVGFKTAGLPGAIIASLAIVLPSLIIIIFIAKFFMRFSEARIVDVILSSLRPATLALIAFACYQMFVISKLNLTSSLFLLLMILIIEKTNKHPALYILMGAIAGLFLKL